MKIAMTGRHGFIGSKLYATLHSAPYEVVELHHTDSFQALREKMVGCKVVIHLGALFIANHKPDEVDALIDANVRYTARVLEAMSLSSCQRIVLAGTTWQYYSETDPNPTSLYSATKRAGLELCRYYVSARGFQVLNLMIYDSYGNLDTRPKLVPGLLRRAKDVETEPMALSPGEQEICLVHVDDIAKAFRLAAERLSRDSTPGFAEYALRGPEIFQVKDIVACIERASGRKGFARLGATPYRPREVMKVWRETPVLPDWKPEVQFERWLRGEV